MKNCVCQIISGMHFTMLFVIFVSVTLHIFKAALCTSENPEKITLELVWMFICCWALSLALYFNNIHQVQELLPRFPSRQHWVILLFFKKIKCCLFNNIFKYPLTINLWLTAILLFAFKRPNSHAAEESRSCLNAVRFLLLPPAQK